MYICIIYLCHKKCYVCYLIPHMFLFSAQTKTLQNFKLYYIQFFFLPEILTMLGNHFHSSGNYFEASCKVRNKCTILAVTNDQYQHNLLSLLLVSHLYNTLNDNGSVEFYTYIRVIDLSHHLQGYLYIIIVLWVCNLVLWHLRLSTVSSLVSLRCPLSPSYQGTIISHAVFTNTLLVTLFQV